MTASSRTLTTYVLATSLFAFASGARADEERTLSSAAARLIYAPPEGSGCPDERDMKNSVAAHLGYMPFQSDAEILVTVEIRREESGFAARVELRDNNALLGKREVSSPASDCSELASATALAISIAIEQLSVIGPEKTASPKNIEQEQRSPSRDVAPTTIKLRPSRVTGHPVLPRFGVGAALGFGSAPSSSFGFVAYAGLRYQALSVGLEGRGDLPASQSVQGGEISSHLLIGSIVPCLHRSIFLGCALLSAGALYGEGAVRTSRRDTTFYAGVGARAGVEVAVFRMFSLELRGDLRATLTPTSLQISDRDVWTTPTLSGALGLGLIWTLE